LRIVFARATLPARCGGCFSSRRSRSSACPRRRARGRRSSSTAAAGATGSG
jgi:hypothetical protein